MQVWEHRIQAAAPPARTWRRRLLAATAIGRERCEPRERRRGKREGRRGADGRPSSRGRRQQVELEELGASGAGAEVAEAPWQGNGSSGGIRMGSTTCWSPAGAQSDEAREVTGGGGTRDAEDLAQGREETRTSVPARDDEARSRWLGRRREDARGGTRPREATGRGARAPAGFGHRWWLGRREIMRRMWRLRGDWALVGPEGICWSGGAAGRMGQVPRF